jgi:hypothetical protein
MASLPWSLFQFSKDPTDAPGRKPVVECGKNYLSTHYHAQVS